LEENPKIGVLGFFSTEEENPKIEFISNELEVDGTQ
jgi:hypothetical protein